MSEEIKPANPVGRPTLYNEEIQKQANEYINNWSLYAEIKNGEDPEKVTHIVNSIPSIAGLSLELGIHRATAYNWSESYPEFFDTLELIQQKQEIFLMHHGLTKGYDSGFAKFMAINVTKYRDKVETVHAVTDEVKKLVIDMGQ
tara:strand:- start:673 stop:1104 length:432 start_codon:yes stop_codon:yes gene_type:complete